MPKIQILSPSLASQIAAGEVVERPASAAKELIENALDAGASRCDVEIEAGGIARLVVTDDGCGMSEDDAKLCLERHATSKLRAFDELQHVSSHGFRGEALPSIASVCRLAVRTREREAEAGVEISLEAGGPLSVRPIGMPHGTVVEIRDLFFNVPARRKFLRSTGTEAGHITEVVEALALSRPDASFTLRRDGRKVREFLRSRTRLERVEQILTEEQLVPCRGERGPLKIEAFLSRPERARQGAQGLRLLVNGRVIRDRMLAATIAQAYGSVLERGRYPRGVVYLDIVPALIDVNVHPQKSEVRFADPRAVADALYGVLTAALAVAFSEPRAGQRTTIGGRSGQASVLPHPSGDAARPISEEVPPSFVDVGATGALPKDGAPVEGANEPISSKVVTHTLAFSRTDSEIGAPAGRDEALPSAPGVESAEIQCNADAAQATASGGNDAGTTSMAPDEQAPYLSIRDSGISPIRPRPAVRWSNLRFVVQLRRMYLLCEDSEGIYLIDQHAAAERVNFDRLRKQYRDSSVKSQTLLFPTTFAMLPGEIECVQHYALEIAAMGLDVRTRGESMLSVHAVPSLLQRASPERLVRDLVSEITRVGGRGFSDAVDLALATMACHGSIRSGDTVTADAATSLLKALDGADFAGHCPHGRPVVTFTSYGELERKVGRR